MPPEDDQDDPSPTRSLTVSIVGGGEGWKNLEAQLQRLGAQVRPFADGLAKWQEDLQRYNIPSTFKLPDEFLEAFRPLAGMQLSRGLTVRLPERHEAPADVEYYAITVPRSRGGRPKHRATGYPMDVKRSMAEEFRRQVRSGMSYRKVGEPHRLEWRTVKTWIQELEAGLLD